MSEDAPQNLSGLWHGQYSYPKGPPPVPFTASLLDMDGALSGSVTEKSILPPRLGEALYATVCGQRDGASVSFSKSYETDDPRYQVVTYEGRVSGDGTEIEGTWRVAGWQGRFLMIRGATRDAGVETRIFETVR
jgi:hypothetical protein